MSFALCWLGISLVFRRSAAHAERAIADIVIDHHGRRITLRALRDTGNELFDPLTGRRILIAEADAVAALFEARERALLRAEAVEAARTLPGFHLIPYACLGGSGLLPVFRPERLCVNGEERDDLAVAVTAAALDPDGEYRAIL